MEESPSINMRYDVLSKNCIDPLAAYSELRKLESFIEYPGTKGGELNRDATIKYVILLYSSDSFLNSKPVKELPERKLMAADAAGFERDKNNEFKEDVIEKLFNLRSFEVLRMVVDYLTYQKNHLWREIITTEQEYEEYIRLRLDPVNAEHDKDLLMAAERKDKLRNSCKSMRKDLESLYKEFFTDNEDVKSLHDVKDKESLERRARKA